MSYHDTLVLNVTVTADFGENLASHLKPRDDYHGEPIDRPYKQLFYLNDDNLNPQRVAVIQSEYPDNKDLNDDRRLIVTFRCNDEDHCLEDFIDYVNGNVINMWGEDQQVLVGYLQRDDNDQTSYPIYALNHQLVLSKKPISLD